MAPSKNINTWWIMRGLNSRPIDYESTALTAELMIQKWNVFFFHPGGLRYKTICANGISILTFSNLHGYYLVSMLSSACPVLTFSRELISGRRLPHMPCNASRNSMRASNASHTLFSVTEFLCTRKEDNLLKIGLEPKLPAAISFPTPRRSATYTI